MASKAIYSPLNFPNRSTCLCSPNLGKQNARRGMPYRATQISSRLQTTRIHRLIEEQGIVLMPGCFDALSASIVQKTGFDAGFISGYALSASLLGKPDFGLLTLVEYSLFLFEFISLILNIYFFCESRCISVDNCW